MDRYDKKFKCPLLKCVRCGKKRLGYEYRTTNIIVEKKKESPTSEVIGNNHKLTKNQLIGVINIVEKLAFNNEENDEYKLNKIQYWLKLKKEM